MAAKKPSRNSGPASRSVVVTVDDDHLPKIVEVAEQLRSRGVQVDSVMEAIGTISGSTGLGNADLERIPGVLSVEEPTQFQLPPSNSPVQ